MELVIVLAIVAVLAGAMFATARGRRTEGSADEDSDEPAIARFVRRHWWLAPLLILVSGFVL